MATPIQDIPTDWAHWFVGLCDGEATFTARPDWRRHLTVTPRLAICMQQDDPLLHSIEQQLGVGSVAPRRANGQRHAGSSWSVDSAADLAYMCAFFTAYPLRSKKRSEFEHWRVLVTNFCHRMHTFDELLAHALALSELFDRRKGRAGEFRIRAAAFLSNDRNA